MKILRFITLALLSLASQQSFPKAMAEPLPKGPYTEACRGCYVHTRESIGIEKKEVKELYCSCKDNAGNYVYTNLNITRTKPGYSRIINNNGHLEHESK